MSDPKPWLRGARLRAVSDRILESRTLYPEIPRDRERNIVGFRDKERE